MKPISFLLICLCNAEIILASTVNNPNQLYQSINSAYQETDKGKAESLLNELNQINSDTYDYNLAKLKLLITLNQHKDAAIQSISILENEDYDDSLARDIIEIRDIFFTYNKNNSDSEVNETIEDYLIEHYSSNPISSNVLLKLSFLEQFHLLYELNKLDITENDYNKQNIMRRAFSNCFKTKIYGDLKNENSTFISKSDLAKTCTLSYEKAVSLAPNQYLKTQIANEWNSLVARYDFNVNSELLEDQLSIITKDIAIDSTIQDQISRFSTELKKAVDLGKQSSRFSEENRTTISNSLAKEFELFAKIGIPDNVFQQILKDIYFFFDEGLPMNLMVQLEEIQELKQTLRWYLWYAIIQPSPNEFERKIIKYQVESFNKNFIDLDENTNIFNEYKQFLEKKASAWMELYEKTKDNRFVPYFKEGYTPYLFSITLDQYKNESIRQDKNRIERLEAMKEIGISSNGYNINTDQRLMFSIINIYTSYITFDRPAVKYLPDYISGRETGTMNEFNIYTFLIK